MQIIDDEANSDIISWLPEGNGFVIHDKKQFEQVILPKFTKKIHYSSFTRRMHRWNFVLFHASKTSSRYFHPRFIKGDYASAMEMMPEPQTQWRKTKDGSYKQKSPLEKQHISKEAMNAIIESNLESYRQMSLRKKPISLRDPSSATNNFHPNSNNLFRSDHSFPRVDMNYRIQQNPMPLFHPSFAPFQSMSSPSRQTYIREDQSTGGYEIMYPGQPSQFQTAWYYY